MSTRVLIIVGGGGWGREALEILPSLNPDWEKTYLATFDNRGWYRRHPVDGPLFTVPRLTPSIPGRTPVGKAVSLTRLFGGIAGVLYRVKPHLVLGLCSDLSLAVMPLARMIGCPTYYVESLTRVRTPSRAARILARLRLVDKVFVQHASLEGELGRASFAGGIL